jgi:23S rRNA pseudouridine2605 synthase
MKKRLSKYLAERGIASRRRCETIIFSKRVKVNGKVALLPQTLVSEEDNISIDQELVPEAEQKVYFLLHKPKGYLCSAQRRPGERLVLDLFQGLPYRLFTIGRLDKDTSGLLLITNDGAFAHKVIHPSSNIDKEYLVRVAEDVPLAKQELLAKGAWIDGAFIRPVRVVKVRRGTLKITVKEGRKREIRHLVLRAGLKLKELVRIRIGTLHLGKMAAGTWRTLSEREKEALTQRK